MLSAASLVVIVVTPLSAAELVMFEADYCVWCKAWDREVGVIYDKTNEADLASLRRVNIDEERPQDLAVIGNIIYTPTFVLMDQGQEIGRILGYPGEANFWGLFGALLKKVQPHPRS